ncbi:hypothetical protein PPNSA23_47140 [Phyllobacterium phragmitis]|uniref:Transcription regulator HTH AraC N-terminal domain-containing protein n=1 Tax=Phyllobacterium phragmitis TaxID=2670329 RepID=A0ABQ0H7A1_9HYPH
MLRMALPPGTPSAPIGKTLSDADAGLLDAALRLLRLLDDPAALPVLGPLVEQEILYRLLAGPAGARMRHITSSQGRAAPSPGFSRIFGNGSALNGLPPKLA